MHCEILNGGTALTVTPERIILKHVHAPHSIYYYSLENFWVRDFICALENAMHKRANRYRECHLEKVGKIY
jgi:hypothetical protein